MRKIVALATLVALVLVSGPVSFAQLVGLEPPASEILKSVPKPRSHWPSGAIEEVWHGPRSMSLYVTVDRSLMEIGLSGDQHHVDMWITIDGESRFVDYDALIEAHAGGRETGPSHSKGPDGAAAQEGRKPTAGEVHNDDVLRWLDERVGAAFPVAEADRVHLDETFLGATLQKSSCEAHIATALTYAAGYVTCMPVAAATAGAVLPYCFVIAVGAYFATLAALEACNPGGGYSLLCDCFGIAPDCMCCSVDPGDVCTCYCPGEKCCDWENANSSR